MVSLFNLEVPTVLLYPSVDSCLCCALLTLLCSRSDSCALQCPTVVSFAKRGLLSSLVPHCGLLREARPACPLQCPTVVSFAKRGLLSSPVLYCGLLREARPAVLSCAPLWSPSRSEACCPLLCSTVPPFYLALCSREATPCGLVYPSVSCCIFLCPCVLLYPGHTLFLSKQSPCKRRQPG